MKEVNKFEAQRAGRKQTRSGRVVSPIISFADDIWIDTNTRKYLKYLVNVCGEAVREGTPNALGIDSPSGMLVCAPAATLPSSGKLSFEVMRKGKDIGDHSYRFSGSPSAFFLCTP